MTANPVHRDNPVLFVALGFSRMVDQKDRDASIGSEYREALAEGLRLAPEDWNLGGALQIARICVSLRDAEAETLEEAVHDSNAPLDSPNLFEFTIKVAESCAKRGEWDRVRALIRAVLPVTEWHGNEWFRTQLGVFLRRLLDWSPGTFELVIDSVVDQVSDQDVLEFLKPFIQAVRYKRTGDLSILDRLFPEVRELVVEITEKLTQE